MPTGPKGQKRPADVNSRAVMIARIATGEIDDTAAPKSKRAEGGKIGGKNRAKTLSPERRAEIASKAAAARWKSNP
jgi:hypothetical protein